jgi:hypothetical protein
MTNDVRAYRNTQTDLVGDYAEDFARFFPDLVLVESEPAEDTSDPTSSGEEPAPTPTRKAEK